MILPERVFGRSSVKRIVLGFAIGPIFVADVLAQLVDELLARLDAGRAGSRTRRSPARWSRRSCRPPQPRRRQGGRRARARPPRSRCCGPRRASRRRPGRAARSSPRRRAWRRRRRSSGRRTAAQYVSRYRSGSPQMPRSIDGHGRVSTRYPPPGIADRRAARRRRCRRRCPGAGTSRSPASAWWRPGSGLIMMAPVSVCHHVSTIGQRSPPMCSQYQTHASGLIGSPTLPSSRSDDRSWRFGVLVAPLHERADRGGCGVEDGDACTSRRSDHSRSLSGKSGVPSYSTPVVRFASGPYTM